MLKGLKYKNNKYKRNRHFKIQKTIVTFIESSLKSLLAEVEGWGLEEEGANYKMPGSSTSDNDGNGDGTLAQVKLSVDMLG